MKVKSGNGIVIPTYALLGSESQSKLIREDFAGQLNLKGKGIATNISSIKDKREELKVNQYSLTVSAKYQEQSFGIKSFDSLKFLLAANPFQRQYFDIYQMTVYIFGPADSQCCAHRVLK